MPNRSNRTIHFMLFVFILSMLIAGVGRGATTSEEYILTIRAQELRFVAQPKLGYVVKIARNNSKLLSLENATPRIQSENAELYVANRPNMKIERSRYASDQNERIIRIRSKQPNTEYVAPLYILGGETVAIIPEIIVRLYHKTDRTKLEELCLELDCTIIRKLLYTEQEFLISAVAQNAEEVLTTVEVLDTADFVEWAWPNIAFQPKSCGPSVENELERVEPNDIYFNKQWHLDAIRAPEAWAYTTGDPNIIIAVIDDGVDINHQDLANIIWTNPDEIPGNGIDDDGNGLEDDVNGWNFQHNDPNVLPYANDAHGTACAGLIAAQGNNDLGVTGVAWNCTIMPIRIASGNAFITDEEIVNAIRYAAMAGADIISNSWGRDTGYPAPVIHTAIREVTQLNSIGRDGNGCVVLVASGNSSGPVTYPANYPEAIAVGAIDENSQIYRYSGSGPELDIVAPSGKAGYGKGNLWTTDISGSRGYNCYNQDPNIIDYISTMGGTSGACPIAAGVAALILSVDPNLINSEVQNIMLTSARDLGAYSWDQYYGYGCVDAYSAVQMTLHPRESILYVDDNAYNDPSPGDPNISDPFEDGSLDHPFDSIQEGVNYGDTVIILPGIYTGNGNYDIDAHGRAVSVCSFEGPESSIIDCQEKGRAFNFSNGEGNFSVLDGLTIKNGCKSNKIGGGIYIEGSDPTIINCIFMYNSSKGKNGNTANAEGGGIYIIYSEAVIMNCSFNRNSSLKVGGGICSYYSDLTITNCTFSENSADYSGGGIYNGGGNPKILDCAFNGNIAIFNCGGATYNMVSNCTVKNCIFTNNSTSGNGGGIYNYDGNPIITNCIFIGNSARENGGAIINTDSISTLTNSIFIGNSAGYNGGGTHNISCNPNITNCIFAGNSADSGGGIYNKYSYPNIISCTITGNSAKRGCGVYGDNSKPTIKNCIIWGNTPSFQVRSSAKVSFSNIQGGWFGDGEGNINEDPLFINPGYWANLNDPNMLVEPNDPNAVWVDGDYHLKSQGGRWDPKSQSWFQDDVTSPCIDAGDPNSPVGGEPEPNGGRINMGAYGGTEQASKSPVAQTIVYIQWLGHSSVKLWAEDCIVYVDPQSLSISPHDATLVCVTHTHGDHYSPSDIAKVSNAQTQFVAPPDVVAQYGKGQAIAPGQTVESYCARLIGVAAYNTNKTNHPKSRNWVGYIIELGGKRMYVAGDTDLTDEMKSLGDIDVAILPAGGTYTMNAVEAAEATQYIKPDLAIPYHWGRNVGMLTDAQRFAELAPCPVKILSGGETIGSDNWLQ